RFCRRKIPLSPGHFGLARRREQSDRDGPVGCSIQTTQDGCLAFRLSFAGLESSEATLLPATAENRRHARDRARVIEQEMSDGTFDYLRWFPEGSLASRFGPSAGASAPRISVRDFFQTWANGDTASRPVTIKWRTNRLSLIRTHVLPQFG